MRIWIFKKIVLYLPLMKLLRNHIALVWECGSRFEKSGAVLSQAGISGRGAYGGFTVGHTTAVVTFRTLTGTGTTPVGVL